MRTPDSRVRQKGKYFFTQCVIKSWNSFPQDVEKAKSTNEFKEGRGKFMLNDLLNAAKQDGPAATCSGNPSIAEFQKQDSYLPGEVNSPYSLFLMVFTSISVAGHC